MKRLIIDNIPDEMFAHLVNGFAGSGTAFQTLDAQAQQTLVGNKILDYCTGIAKAHAINMAQLAAARQTAALADTLIAQTTQSVEITLEELP